MNKPQTTREHMALQLMAIKARPHIVFSGVNMLERAKARSSYDRRRAIPQSRNLPGSGWSKSWDTRVFRLPELLAAAKRLALKARKTKKLIALGIPYRRK